MFNKIKWLVLTSIFLPMCAFAEQGGLPQEFADLNARVTQLEAQLMAVLAQLDAHAGNATAHHAPYADADAVAAVGPHFSGNHADLTNVLETQHHVPAASELDDLLLGVSRGIDPNTGYDTLKFTGMNVQIVNGSHVTWSANGTGNLIIGYNESRERLGKVSRRN